MSYTDVGIASQALEMAGLAAITAWTDLPAGPVAQRHYERVVPMLIELNNWKFAWWTWKLDTPEAQAPVSDFRYAFTLPADLIWPQGAGGEERSRGIAYIRAGRQIWCDHTEIYVRGLRRPAEDQWPHYFANTAVWHLAAVYAVAIRHDAGYGVDLLNAARGVEKVAISRDSQQQTADAIDTDWPLVSVRG